VTAAASGARIAVRAIPRSGRSELAGIRDGRLLVRVAAPPVDGAANEAVMALLADVLDLPRRVIRVSAGRSSRNKTIEIEGAVPDVTRERIARLLTK
jgi:uncharacterized protein YggU (UPF0235/DUF167 family)